MKTQLMALVGFMFFSLSLKAQLDPGIVWVKGRPEARELVLDRFEPSSFFPKYHFVVLDCATLRQNIRISDIAATGTLTVGDKRSWLEGLITSADKPEISPTPSPNPFPNPTDFKLYIAVPKSQVGTTGTVQLNLKATVAEPGKAPYQQTFKVVVKR